MPEEYPDLLEILSLHLASGIGWRLYQKLETAFGSARAILNAPQSRLEAVPGIGPVRSQAILDQRSMDAARRERDLAAQQGITILDYYHPDYPLLLQQSSDPPLILYVKGTLEPDDGNGLSIVGTRQCSNYGRDTARKFARELAQRNVTIVSGLARGIDTAAHLGALEGGGRTVAVLGSGLLKIYPQENDELYEQITGQGAVVSEFPLNMPAAADHFPRRNRIIAWLTRASLVVEGDEKSGAMITARFANEEGRTVLALPGRIDTPIARGPHGLIRDGATLVRGLDDVLEVLKVPYLPTPGPVARQRLRQEAGADAKMGPSEVAPPHKANAGTIPIRSIPAEPAE
ncbi:MAG TPA: DNA-processing protein DprA, partial [Planctomycetota bacterium]|nr:DNA-processing protein DprA [Planctomycetota bacterium]